MGSVPIANCLVWHCPSQIEARVVAAVVPPVSLHCHYLDFGFQFSLLRHKILGFPIKLWFIVCSIAVFLLFKIALHFSGQTITYSSLHYISVGFTTYEGAMIWDSTWQMIKDLAVGFSVQILCNNIYKVCLNLDGWCHQYYICWTWQSNVYMLICYLLWNSI